MTDTTTTVRDLTLLDQIVTWLEENPLVHDQQMWGGTADWAPAVTIPGDGEVCGTACCLAGWTLLFDHEHYRFDGKVNSIVDKRNESRWLSSDDFTELAGDRLKLTYLEASVLFDSFNTLEVLRTMTTDLQSGVNITARDYDPRGSA